MVRDSRTGCAPGENSMLTLPQSLLARQGSRILESSPVHETEEAAAYDAMIRRHGWLLTRPFVKLVAGLQLTQARVLDIGTGPGWVPIELAQRRPDWEVWGLDASATMLEQARGHAATAGVGDRLRFVEGIATDLPFPAGHFDLVISHFTLHHLERPESMFNEVARVVRPGGQILIKDLRRQPSWKAGCLLAFSKYILRYSPLQLQMYRESMAAALTIDEVRTALKNSRLALAAVRGFRGLDYVIRVAGNNSHENCARNS